MEFREQTFNNERIVVDGNTFTGCAMHNCTFVFASAQPFTFSANMMSHCRFEFVGAAGATLGLLKDLYHGGFGELIERTFDDIRVR